MKHHYQIENEELRLRPLHQNDIELLRQWRNTPELTQYLSKIPYITEEMQLNWFTKYLSDESEITFAIDFIGDDHAELIGSMALSEVNNKKAECGKFLIGSSKYMGKGFGRKSLALCLMIAFEQIGLDACIAHAHPLNAPSLVSFVNEGFQIRSSRPFQNGGFEYEMELTRARYDRLRKEK